MSSCTPLPANAQKVSIVLAGSGEPLLRLEKRMSCAAAGLGIRLDMEIRKDTDALGIPYLQTPAVLHEGVVIFNGLPRTEEIEAWLKNPV
ncbi:MAG: thioredoxin family protein [Gallionella sp.]